MSQAEWVGLAAGFLVAMGLVPQIVRVVRLKDAQEISLAFNLMTLAGTLLWLAYGAALGLLSVVLWNSANAVLLAALLAVKLKYGMSRAGPLPIRGAGAGQSRSLEDPDR
jgi:MtN3 and saliva related transmembrane protein